MTIREVRESDFERIAEIYSPYVLETPVSFEYEAPKAEELRARRESFRPFPYLVLEEDGRVEGYAYAHPFAVRRAYRRSAEVTIYLDKEFHRRGGGRLLYTELEERIRLMGYVHNLYALVVHPGFGSVEFHEALGYRIIGIMNGCGEKFGQLWNICYMEKLI